MATSSAATSSAATSSEPTSSAATSSADTLSAAASSADTLSADTPCTPCVLLFRMRLHRPWLYLGYVVYAGTSSRATSSTVTSSAVTSSTVILRLLRLLYADFVV